MGRGAIALTFGLEEIIEAGGDKTAFLFDFVWPVIVTLTWCEIRATVEGVEYDVLVITTAFPG